MSHALAGASGRGAPPPAPARSGVVVAGGGGALGSALLERLLATASVGPVRVVVTRALATGVGGLEGVPLPAAPEGRTAPDAGAAARGSRGLAMADWPAESVAPTGIVVFDRPRHANGREAAFWRPEPADLPGLAAGWQGAGVRHLLVVVPHTAAGLPQALRAGLASLDEQAVAALGFDHLVFMRPAQAPPAERAGHPGERLARWMLSQLTLMVPPQHMPVRALKVGQFGARIAAGLAGSPPGTRVVPAEVVWQATQSRELDAVADAWLQGRPLPPLRTAVRRL